MAGSLAGEALLSGVFNVLLDRLTPKQADLINFICGKKLDSKLLHHLKPSLIAARAVLNDAELKQFTDPAVKDWLNELKDVVYDLEDLMDELFTKATAQKKVRYFSFASLNLRDTSMANKLEAITDRIEHIVRQRDYLKLEKSSGTETMSMRRQVPYREAEVSEVYGRKKEKQDIMKLMFNEDGDQLSVIPIVGMGGVGKTTLVYLLYKDNYVRQKFDYTAWVCVSEAFDLLRIGQTIIKFISPTFVCDNMDLHLLQLHLAEKLERKRLLVVLDDYWNENYIDWVNLKNLLHNGVEGCTILLTTRIEHVALMVKTISSFYHLNALSDKDCLSIFAAHAFSFRDSVVKSCLEKIGKDVATKCKGLPLAAKVLGGLFRSKCDFDDWNNILEDAMWDSLDNEIIPALKVSYYYLPPHLKQCFAYCSLFPEGYVFDKEELILMWMAEGFLQLSKRNITLEEVGYGYLDDLTSRSFFQSLPESYVYVAHGCNKSDRCFVMHDLIHALATHVAGDFYFRLGENRNEIGTMTRHLSCDFQNCHCLDRGVFQKSKGLRTFIGLNFSYILKTVENASHILSSNLKHLRTLSLRELYTLKTVPESIGKFVHLRYLDLSGTSIVNLPNSICRLYNLQTLKLCYCSFLMILPSDMQDLVNLRYLDLSSSSSIAGLPHSLCKLYNLQTLRLNHCRSLEMLPSDMQYLVTLRHLDVRNTKLKEMPRGLGKLKDLQFLSDFIVGKEQETRIGELGGISKLKGWIAVSNLENVKNENEASDARMMEKKQIKNLTLSWSDLGDVEDTRTEKDVLAHLQPHWDLEELEIICYRGTIFSDWLGSPSYHKMTSLRLENCTNCCMLPSLGQLPALKKLYIIRLESVVSVGDEFLKGDNCASMIPFPSLEYLHFSRMASWEQWHSINTEAFPKLQLLTVSFCNKLAGSLPLQLLSLETLEIKFCSLFSSCIPKCPKLQNLHAFKSGNMVWQEQELPPLLCTLDISGCWMLESMLDSFAERSHLQQLTISDCSNISPSSMIHLPPLLQELNVQWCKNVDFVMSPTAPLQNLQSIHIGGCVFLKFISDDMKSLLPSLRKLSICGVDKMEEFPEGILVPSLRELHIEWCNMEFILSHQAAWHLLSNITYLRIFFPHDSHVKCFPEGCSLPSTLTTLELNSFGNLETLNCTGLQHLTSLQCLNIKSCPKLEKMLGEKLPVSLKKLHIQDCLLLEEKYRNRDEQLLRQISHIPLINSSEI